MFSIVLFILLYIYFKNIIINTFSIIISISSLNVLKSSLSLFIFSVIVSYYYIDFGSTLNDDID